MSLSFPCLSTRKSSIDPFGKQEWLSFVSEGSFTVNKYQSLASFILVACEQPVVMGGRVKWGDWVLLQVAGWKELIPEVPAQSVRGVSTDRVMEDIIHRKQSVLVSFDVIMCLLSLEAFSTVGRVGSRSCSWNCICLHHLSDAVTEGWAVVGKHLRGICHFGLGLIYK